MEGCRYKCSWQRSYEGRYKKGAKALNKASKAAKKKVSNTKKKVVASLKTQKKTVKKKIGKIVKKRGKVFTKARKLKNNLTKKEQINNLKKKLNKAVLAAKSIPKKTANYVKDNAKNIASFAADSTPIVGTVKAFQQAATGVDLITGQKLSMGDRIAEGVGGVVAIFPIPGAKHVGKYGTKGIIKFGEFAADVSTNFVKNIKNKVVAKPSKPSKPPNSTGKYQVGAYKDIKGVEGFDAHHAGQKALMKKLVKNYDLNTAPAINVPKVGHTIGGPNGIVSRSTKGIDNPRQLLARDINELRRVYDDIPNSALKELIELNKKMYPEMRK